MLMYVVVCVWVARVGVIHYITPTASQLFRFEFSLCKKYTWRVPLHLSVLLT